MRARAMMRASSVLMLRPNWLPNPDLSDYAQKVHRVQVVDATGMTIVLTTHNMEEAETIADRVAIIDEGRIVASGTPEEVRARVGYEYRVDLRGDGIEASELSSYGLVRRIGDRYRVYLSDSTARELLDLAIARGWTASLSRTTLEDAFVLLVGEVEEHAG
ncbi:MAG: hypothetical protein QXM81_05255 [Nitrososphaerota archaeon]